MVMMSSEKIIAEGAISQEFGPQPWEARVGLGLLLALPYGFLCIGVEGVCLAFLASPSVGICTAGSAPAGQLLAF